MRDPLARLTGLSKIVITTAAIAWSFTSASGEPQASEKQIFITAPVTVITPGVREESLSEIAETPEKLLTPRAKALEVAGAFSNDGFKARDSHWEGEVSKEKPALIQVNLFSGNEYWFIAAGANEASTLKVSLFDEKGNPVRYEPYLNGTRAAAGFSPSYSGPFYVKIEETSGKPTSFCLIYSYK